MVRDGLELKGAKRQMRREDQTARSESIFKFKHKVKTEALKIRNMYFLEIT
jgi:hypothetical protein